MSITNKIKDKPYIHTLFNKIMYAVVTFVANAIIARALGVGLKGEYAWVLNMSNLIAIIAGMGIYQSIPYFKRNGQEETDIVQEYVNIFLLQFIIYVVVVAVILLFNRKESMVLVLILALGDMYSQQLNMLMLVDNIFMRNKIFIWGAYLNIVISVLCYVFFKDNLAVAVGVLVCVKVFYVFGYMISMKKFPHPFRIKIKSVLQKLKFGYLPMLSFLLITLNYKVDVLMLKADSHITPIQLSFYAVGVSIAELAWFIPDVFKEVLFFKTAQNNNYEEVSAILRISNFVIGFVIIFIIIAIKPMIWICYGKAFMPSYKVTILLFLGIPAMSWFKIIQTLFNAQGRRKLTFSVLAVSAVINIVTNALTIPRIGIYGAAVSSILSYSICGIFFIIIYSKVSKTKIRHLIIMRKDDIKVLIKGKRA